MGYSSQQKDYLYLHVSANRCYISRHVVFNENFFPFSQQQATISTTFAHNPTSHIFPSISSIPPMFPSHLDTSSTSHSQSPEVTPTHSQSSSSLLHLTNSPVSNNSPLPSTQVDLSSSPCSSPSTILLAVEVTSPILHFLVPNQNVHPMITRVKHDIYKPKLFTASSSLFDACTLIEPKSYKEAMQQPEWYKAMQSEYKDLMRNHTWYLVSAHLEKTIVGCEWVFKLKLKPNGSVERCKV